MATKGRKTRLKEQQVTSIDIELTPFDNHRLVNLCGKFDEHIRQIEKRLSVEIFNRGNAFSVSGEDINQIRLAVKVLRHLYQLTDTQQAIDPNQVHLVLQQLTTEKTGSAMQQESIEQDEEQIQSFSLRTPNGEIRARTQNQQRYLTRIQNHAINFGIGPAGTGKTFLAVACAVQALEQQKVRRIILVRPVVEAGERLGFLPGDLTQKIDPYLRPLYDALYEMLGPEKVNKYLEQQIIEIAPLAYMRGRTLNDAFIILDEGQNTTQEQMKMFLTRIGFSSTAVITGDVTQIDLPRGKNSGLKQAIVLLKDIAAISFSNFKSSDVIRHPIVQEIINAYDNADKKQDN